MPFCLPLQEDKINIMKRYERQIHLSEIGMSGQQKLAEAKVVVIGVGGLGCSVLQNLAGAGIGTIGIVDGDVVEETNLHRQFLYTLNDCGKNKVAIAAKVVSKQNPEVKIIQYPDYFSKQNGLNIASDYQIIVDCTDAIPVRYLINDLSVAIGIPMVYASIHKFEGQISVFNYKKGPTYRCLFPQNERLEAIPNCNDSGVLGVLPNILGAMQANEILKIVLEIGDVLSGKLLLYNSLDNIFQNIEFESFKENNKEFKMIYNSAPEVNFLANDYSFILDIREEYEEPKLNMESIRNVPLSQLDDFVKKVNVNQKILLICQNGNRSELAVDYLVKKGFVNVFHLQNGIESLERTASYDNR